MDPTVIEGLWERTATPTPSPAAQPYLTGHRSQRSRIAAILKAIRAMGSRGASEAKAFPDGNSALTDLYYRVQEMGGSFLDEDAA